MNKTSKASPSKDLNLHINWPLSDPNRTLNECFIKGSGTLRVNSLSL